MLVKLYGHTEKPELEAGLKKHGILIKRGMPADRNRAVQFVKNHFGDGWSHDCEYAFTNHPVSCFLAVQEKSVVGFACYDVQAKNFFGPIGVLEEYRKIGVGESLLRRCLRVMEGDGYAYAVIGWVDGAEGFYSGTVGAVVIENSCPGIYRNLISME